MNYIDMAASSAWPGSVPDKFQHLATWALSGGRAHNPPSVDYADPAMFLSALSDGLVDPLIPAEAKGVMLEIDAAAFGNPLSVWPEGDWASLQFHRNWFRGYFKAAKERWPTLKVSAWNFATWSAQTLWNRAFDDAERVRFKGWYNAASWVLADAGVDSAFFPAYFQDPARSIEGWTRYYDWQLELASTTGVEPIPLIWPRVSVGGGYLSASEMGAVLSHVHSSGVSSVGFWNHPVDGWDESEPAIQAILEFVD